jgi:hypothetical protein
MKHRREILAAMKRLLSHFDGGNGHWETPLVP